jgi:hypothetical protein
MIMRGIGTPISQSSAERIAVSVVVRRAYNSRGGAFVPKSCLNGGNHSLASHYVAMRQLTNEWRILDVSRENHRVRLARFLRGVFAGQRLR